MSIILCSLFHSFTQGTLKWPLKLHNCMTVWFVFLWGTKFISTKALSLCKTNDIFCVISPFTKSQNYPQGRPVAHYRGLQTWPKYLEQVTILHYFRIWLRAPCPSVSLWPESIVIVRLCTSLHFEYALSLQEALGAAFLKIRFLMNSSVLVTALHRKWTPHNIGKGHPCLLGKFVWFHI